jgi:Tfp pilus assembly PilM family ATPase
MLLTKNDLNKYLKSRRIVISDSFAKELIKEYGNPVTDGDGHVFEYSEQDVTEQIRKKIQKYLEEGYKKL